MANRFQLGSYKYFPVLVIWGRADVDGTKERRDSERARA